MTGETGKTGKTGKTGETVKSVKMVEMVKMVTRRQMGACENRVKHQHYGHLRRAGLRHANPDTDRAF
jgi:hypothetical protein